MIIRKRVGMIEHNLKYPGIVTLILEGMVAGKNRKGKQKISCIVRVLN